MTYQSTAYGEFPTGVHWTPGEIRDIEAKPEDVPAWLKPYTPTPPAKQKRGTKKGG